MNQSLVAAELPSLAHVESGRVQHGLREASLLARLRAGIHAGLQRIRLPDRKADSAEAADKVIYLRKIIPRVGILNLSGQRPMSEVVVVVYECPRGGRILPRIQVTEIA